MATVRFSQELRSDIKCNALNLMKPAIDRAMAARPDKSWGDRLYNIIFAKAIPHIAHLDAHWTRHVSAMRVSTIHIAESSVPVELEFSFDTPRGVPESSWGDAYVRTVRCITYGVPDFVLTDHPEFAEFIQEIVAWRLIVDAAQKRADEFLAAVLQVVDATVTLAPALKAWPPLWDLLPEKTKDKHREVSVRADKRDVSLDVDLNKLTAMSTAAKFGV